MEDIAAVWARYKATPTTADREALIVAHIPLVRYVASRMIPTLHSSVERQDLVAWGYFGLMDAIERFNPATGVKFATFATYRIRGSITDEMRAQAWEPRSVRARTRVVVQTMLDLEADLGRPPTEIEVATHVGISVAELRKLASDRRLSYVSSIDKQKGHRTGLSEDSTMSIGDTLAATDTTMVDEEATLLAYRMAEAIPHLCEQERILLGLLYAVPVKVPVVRCGMTLKEVAQVLGVTESWVSLLHTRALISLQRTLSGQPD